MRKQCNIPEWNEKGSLIFASKTVDRPILSANDLTQKELNKILKVLIGNMIKEEKQIV